jgi:hypothetical protein
MAPLRRALVLPLILALASCSWFRKDEAEPAKQEMMAPAMPTMPVQPAMITASPPPPPPPGPAYGGHVASYKRRADADRGWRQLTQKYSRLRDQKAHIVDVNLGRKGKWTRLIVGDFTNASEADQFCRWAQGERLYCKVMKTNGAG